MEILAPLEGVVLTVQVAPGDTVKEGQTVITMTSMKMEIPISSQCAGQIAEILVEEGSIVELGSVIARLR